MAKPYNLTVQINLQGPKNLNNVVNNIQKQLSNIQANVNVKVSPQTARALQGISQQSKQVKASADDAANAMEKFGKSAGLAVKRFGAFTAATVGFYAITRATQQSLEKFIEYDKQLTRIAQVTNTSKSSLSALSAEITNLSTSLGASSSSLAEVAVTLSQAGLSARETEKALRALSLTTLAPTFNDINQTVEGSIALMKQFSISTNQLESALGSINAVAGSFAVEAGDLITAVQRAGGVFAAASQGVSEGTNALNEFLAVFTSVRATTREGAETIATGLRTIFTRLQREDTIAALEAFGVTLTDLEGKFIGPYKAIEQLSKGLRSLDPRSLQFSGIVEELGGFRQVGKVIPLIQQFTTAQQALNVAQQGSGSLARDAALGQDTLAVKISKVQQEFDALIRSIGETSEFRQFIQLSLDLASALIKVADAVKPIIPALAALGAAKVLGGVPSIARGFKKGLGFNTGGFVPGVGNNDTVEAALTPGEYVIRKAAVKAIGRDTLERVNRTGKLPEYNSGGPVRAEQLSSVSLRNRITRTGTSQQYRDGERINDLDEINFNIRSIPIDASPKIGNTEFEKRVAATLGGQWIGGNAPVDVVAPGYGPIEVRNRTEFTPGPELLDKLIRYKLGKKQNVLSNTMGIDKNINAGQIFVAYNTGKLDEKKKQELQAEGRSKKIAPKSALRGAKKRGFDFRETFKPTKRANTGGPISGRDTVDALLTPGEYVINEKAARSLGEQTLDRLNKADKIGFNKGGAVGPVRLRGGGYPSDRQWRRQGLRIAEPVKSAGTGTIGALLAAQAAVTAFESAIGDTTATTKATNTALQGLASGAATGIATFESLRQIPGVSQKFARNLGIVVAGFSLADAVLRAWGNSLKDVELESTSKQLEKSLDSSSEALESYSKAVNKAASDAFKRSVETGVSSIQRREDLQEQRTYSLPQGFDDAQKIMNSLFGTTDLLASIFSGFKESANLSQGAKDALDRSQRERQFAVDRVRSREGFTGLFSAAFDPTGFNKKVEEEIATLYEKTADSYKQFSDIVLRKAEIDISKGASIDQIFKNLGEAERASIALDDPEVARRVREAGGQDSDAGKAIINKEVRRELTVRLSGAVADRNARQAKTESDMLQVMFSKLFNSMEQAFKVVASNTESRFARASDALSASLGKTRIGYDNTVMKNVLENPKAFSDATVESTINKVAPLLGDKGNRIGQLALASTRIEDDAAAVTDRILSSGKKGGVALKAIGVGIRNMFSGMNLGADVERAIDQQLSAAFTKAQGELGEGAPDTKIRERVQEIVSELPQFKGALEVMIQASNTFSSAQKGYSQAIQEITEAVLQQREYFNRAADIRREGSLRLREARGETIGLNDIIRNTLAGVAQQTGGVTDVQQLFQNLQRGLKQREQIVARRDAISGDVSRNEEFKRLTQSLAELDLQLAQNRAGLEALANSTEIANAALNRISEIQARAQEKLSFGEKLATSTPEEFGQIRQTYADLENIISGGQLTLQNSVAAQQAMFQAAMQGGDALDIARAGTGALADQKGNVLSLLKELKAFFGDNNKAFNERYETVLRSFLEQTGLMGDMTWGPMFEQAFAEMRGQDNETKRAINVYNRAINIQEEANTALGKLIQPTTFLVQANQTLNNSIVNLTNAINNIPGLPNQPPVQPPPRQRPINQPGGVVNRQPGGAGGVVNRQSGGIVYASEGKYVEMKPKGTDTIPAMLTRGEFVVNAKATKKNRGLLEQINNGGTPSFDNGVAYAPEGGHIDPKSIYAWYKQRYGMGVQKVLPIQVKKQIRQRIDFERKKQAYLLMYGQQIKDKQAAYRKDYYKQIGVQSPESIKQKLLKDLPDSEEKELIQSTNDPRRIYILARKYGIDPKTGERNLFQNTEERNRKIRERNLERQKSRERSITEDGRVAVPAGPVRVPDPETQLYSDFYKTQAAKKYPIGSAGYNLEFQKFKDSKIERSRKERIDRELTTRKEIRLAQRKKEEEKLEKARLEKSKERDIKQQEENRKEEQLREKVSNRIQLQKQRKQEQEIKENNQPFSVTRKEYKAYKIDGESQDDYNRRREQLKETFARPIAELNIPELEQLYGPEYVARRIEGKRKIEDLVKFQAQAQTEQKFLRFVRDREAGLPTSFYQTEYSSEEIQSLRDKYPKEFEKYIIRPKRPAQQPTQEEKNQNALDEIRRNIAAQNPRTRGRIKSRRGTTTPRQGSGRKESLDGLAALGVGAAENVVPTLVAAAAVGFAPFSGGGSLGLLATLGIGGAAGYATSLAQDAVLQSVAPDIYEQKEEIKQRSPGMALVGGFLDPALGKQLFKPGKFARAFAQGAAQRETYNATRLAQQNQVFRSLVRQGVNPEIADDAIRSTLMTGDEGFLLDALKTAGQNTDTRLPLPDLTGPSTRGSGSRGAVPRSKPQVKSPETSPTNKPQTAGIPKIVQNSGLADVWPNLSPRAQKAALQSLKTSEKAAAARAAKATPKPKITAKDPGEFIGPTSPQGKAPSGRRIEIDPRQYGFSPLDFTTRAAPVSRGIPVGTRPATTKLTDIIPESGLSTTSSKAAAKPTGLEPIPGTAPFKVQQPQGFGGTGTDFIPTATRPKPQINAGATKPPRASIELPPPPAAPAAPPRPPKTFGPPTPTVADKYFGKMMSNIEQLPETPEGMTRLYRVGETARDYKPPKTARLYGEEISFAEWQKKIQQSKTMGDMFDTNPPEAAGRWFTDAPRELSSYINMNSPEELAKLPTYYVDVPTKQLQKYNVGKEGGQSRFYQNSRNQEREFVLPDEILKRALRFMSSGGVVKPKYLASGGFTTNMINTDPLYENYYAGNKFAGYVSPSDKIKDLYHDSKRGLQSMVDSGQLDPSSREYEIRRKMTEYGFGLDAANRPVVNSPTGGYGDPRSNEKDYASIFSPNGNGPVRFRYFSSGGLATGDFQALAEGTDRYPAMLSRGEMVMNPEATRRNKGLLKALNRSRGGMVKNGITYAADGTDGGIGISAAGNGELRITGDIKVTPEAIPDISTMPTPMDIASPITAPTQEIGTSFDGISNLNSSIYDLVGQMETLTSALSTGANTLTGRGGAEQQIDFTTFTNGVTSFGTFAGPLTQAVLTLSQLDFGVINDGAQQLLTTAQTLGGSFGRFNNAVTSFSAKTDELIAAVQGMQINGTINVQGSIAVQPMTVNIAGLEAIEARLQGFAALITSSLATALAQDNPGFNTTSLSSSITLS